MSMTIAHQTHYCKVSNTTPFITICNSIKTKQDDTVYTWVKPWYMYLDERRRCILPWLKKHLK
jgi:hypothetical protein